MKKLSILLLGALAGITCLSAQAELTLTSTAWQTNTPLPYKYGYCQPNGKGEVTLSDDISPPVSWTGAPKGTKSFAFVVTDPTIPVTKDFDVKGTTIPKNNPRETGYHWTLVNIPVTTTSLPEGAGSKGFVPGGKPPGQTKYGLTGINVYNAAFKSPIADKINLADMTKKQLDGLYGDYDGPCSPWNDMAIHHYTYTIYALDVAKLNLPENGHFTGPDVMKAMKGHILAQDSMVGDYTTNPILIKQGKGSK